MKLAFLDTETQGLNATDNITEIAIVVVEVREDNGFYKELTAFESLIYDISYPPQTGEIIEATGITDQMLMEKGRAPVLVLSEAAAILEHVDYVVAHNAAYDKGMLEDKFKRFGIGYTPKPWVCTQHDVEYPKKYRCKQLSHLAYDHGIYIEPEKRHRAMNDVRLLVQFIQDKYDIKAIIENRNEPWVFLRAIIPPPWEGKGGDGGKGRDWAKAQGYSYERAKGTDAPVFKQCWVKRVKQKHLKAELEDKPYSIVQLEVQ